MKIFRFISVLLSLLNFLLFSEEYNSPEVVMNELLTLFKSYKIKEEGKILTDDEKRINKEIENKIENIFNYKEMINAVIRDQIESLNPKQKEDFFFKFKKLIGLIAFPKASSYYNNCITTINKSYSKDDKVFIPTNTIDPKKDINFLVVYIFKKSDNRWMLIDVEINEHSLVDAYRLQINRIVKKDGISGLFDVLNKKYEEYTKNE